MTYLASPNFSNPNSILVGLILCDNIAQATWHTRYTFDED